MAEELSPRQHEMLAFIQAHWDQHRVVPSYREIGAALGMKSTNAVSDHLKALTRKGYVERVGEPGNPRSLRVTGAADRAADSDVVSVPVLGRVAAGVPLLAEQNYQGAIRVDRALLPPGGDVFGLIVKGDSMVEDGILDGDTIFVRQRSEVRNGGIAVVLVDGDATVKRVYREGERLRLQPANRDMEPRWVDPRSGDVSIVGLVVGVYRRVG
jgi:repressor LexA